jgi:hypothetical protein
MHSRKIALSAALIYTGMAYATSGDGMFFIFIDVYGFADKVLVLPSAATFFEPGVSSSCANSFPLFYLD